VVDLARIDQFLALAPPSRYARRSTPFALRPRPDLQIASKQALLFAVNSRSRIWGCHNPIEAHPAPAGDLPHRVGLEHGRATAMLALLKCRRNEREKCRLIVRVAVPSSPVACTAPSSRVSPKLMRGRAPSAGWLALNVSMYSFGRRDVRHMHQHRLGAVHVEYFTAGTLPKAMGGLARSIAGRLQPPAGIPQRIFPFGPISPIAPERDSAACGGVVWRGRPYLLAIPERRFRRRLSS
jgi:hypothetical protein